MRDPFLRGLVIGWAWIGLGLGVIPSWAQVSSVSSTEDIDVADGLQLPTYGILWSLDSWHGVQELVQLNPADASGNLSPFAAHALELKGEAAKIRIHDTTPQFFLHGVTERGDKPYSGFVVVLLSVEGNRRRAGKNVSEFLKREKKWKGARPDGVIELTQQRIGVSDWYKLSPQWPLEAGEYAIVPLPSDVVAVVDGIHDFAIDPQAPENRQIIRSEKDRPAN